jgi:fatty acid-binding protein DegV
VVLPNLDVTDEVAQRISAHSRELARLHHQDNSQKYKDARQQAIAASKNRTLPVALLGPLASKHVGSKGATVAVGQVPLPAK